MRTEALRLPDDTPGLDREAIRLINDRLSRLASEIPGAAAAPLIQTTHEMRIGKYPPAEQAEGTLLYETNRTTTYVQRDGHWKWHSGLFQALLAKLPTDLTPHDTGFLFYSQDYDHRFQWLGTQWDWAPGDDQSGYFQDFAFPPSGTGWKLADGTATTYVDRRGGTHAFTPPDMTGGVYRKGGAWSGTLSAAGTVTLAGVTGDTSGGTPAGTVSAPVLTMNSYTPAGTVAAPVLTMNSYTPAGTFSGTLGSTSSDSAGTVNAHVGASLNVGAGVIGIEVFQNAGDVAHAPLAGHSHTYTPAGTFAGTPATLTGTNSAPAFTGSAATLTGTNSAPTFTGSALAAHHHDLSAATATLTADPVKNLAVPVYFRR